MEEKTNSGIQAFDRMFSIIEHLSNNPRGCSLSELCASCSLPKATVSRMLSSLITLGYAGQDIESKKYRLTLRLFEIGSRVVGYVNILSIAKPYLEQLSATTSEAVHLVSRVGDEVVYLYKEEASNSLVRMSSCVGLHNPMYCTGVGKSILAFLPEQEFAEIWSRTKLIPFTNNTIVDIAQMHTELANIRKNGYAIDNEEHELGIRCVAVPIRDFSGAPIGAISISAPCARLSDEIVPEYAQLLQSATSSISCYLGNRP